MSSSVPTLESSVSSFPESLLNLSLSRYELVLRFHEEARSHSIPDRFCVEA
ncbi:MAG: hypothetical protein HYU64_07265 [Armatimonadetes bacterium]|nr:hypothetical protein [Armatimonadota bacterium]